MSSKKNKKNPGMTREMEMESARMFGKHVTKEKALLLFVVTMLACAMPMQLGIRLWDRIPEIVETGLIGMDGKDDSLPRAAVVFLVPGLMCLLNLICHGQLWFNQKRMTLPNTPVRLVGRWGFPDFRPVLQRPHAGIRRRRTDADFPHPLCAGAGIADAGRPRVGLPPGCKDRPAVLLYRGK